MGSNKKTESGSMFREALDAIYCSIIILDQNGHPTYINPSAKNMIRDKKVSIEDVLQRLSMAVDLVRGSGRFQIAIGEAAFVCRVSPRFLEEKRQGTTIVIHESGDTACLVQEMDVESSMFRELKTCVESAYDGFMIVDARGNVIRVNATTEKMLQRSRRELLGRNIRDLSDEGILQCPNFLEVFDKEIVAQKQEATTVCEVNGQELMMTSAPVLNEHGMVTAVVTNIRNLQELNDLQKKLSYQIQISEKYGQRLALYKQKQHQKEKLVVHSPAMKKVLNLIYSISDVDSTVLITGETGVGKEVFANEVYSSSQRKSHPIIRVNCGAIPPTLVESELFGYEDGAFTGARKRGKPGFFELAHMGTLFLDEIGELPLDVQVKLLRALQSGEIMRIGATKPTHVDVRVIAATNRNLWEMVERGEFRQDLFYRLNVITIEIPPLRKRKEDILPLCVSFLERFNKRYKKHKEISTELGAVLEKLPWKGNVRELENAIENLVILSTNDVLTPEDLPERYRIQTDSTSQVEIRGILPLKEMVRQAELQLIHNAQEEFGSTQEVAKALGVDVSTINRKLSRR